MMTAYLGPVIARPALSKDEVVGAEYLAERRAPHAVHGAGLQVHEHGAGHVLAARRLVVVHVDALQLEVALALDCSEKINQIQSCKIKRYLRYSFQWGQCHARRRLFPRTWNRSDCRTDQLGCGQFHAFSECIF